MAGVARHGRRSGAVVVRVVGRVGGQPQRSARVDGDGVVMVLLWRIEDPCAANSPALINTLSESVPTTEIRGRSPPSPRVNQRGPAASAGWI